MKAVFDTKPTSVYDDDTTRHYQFPRRYLDLVQRCVGDRNVLRRPRADGGNLAYFGCALVSRLEPDVVNPSMTFAHLRDFMQFPRPVPWKLEGRYWEEGLRGIPQQQVGVNLRGRSVRALSEDDFVAIVAAGAVGYAGPRKCRAAKPFAFNGRAGQRRLACTAGAGPRAPGRTGTVEPRYTRCQLSLADLRRLRGQVRCNEATHT
jgi:hypothetical protein